MSRDHPLDGPREASGVSTRLVLAYVEREGGRSAVRAVLERAGLAGCESELRDENRWMPAAAKRALFEAAAHVLGEPRVGEHVGRAVLELDIGTGLKRVLRALGTPRLVYGELARACAKFNTTHRMSARHLAPGAVVVRSEDLSGAAFDPQHCAYTVGLLASVPGLFGLPFARVEHLACAGEGADACLYHVRWSEPHTGEDWLAPVAAGAAALVAGLGGVAAPGAGRAPQRLAAVLALASGGLGVRTVWRLRRRVAGMIRRTADHDETSERLVASLRDLSADLRPDEVLAKIARNAQSAVGGKEFAVLVAGQGMRCVESSGVPAESLAVLEAWATEALPGLERDALLIDDVSAVPALTPLARAPEMPLGSLCAAPLRFGGGLLGVLVALGHAPESFLPHDAELLSVYAAEAAVALSNANMVERLQRLADEDPLTGLTNHRRFHATLAAETARAQREGSTFSVIAIDLDRFARINDAHGQAEGDRVLRAVAEAMRSRLRAYDVIGRIAGQQFAALLPGTASEEAEDLAERVRAAVGDVHIVDTTLTCSAGVASHPADVTDPTDVTGLLQAAFDALRDAKSAGRDRIRRADPAHGRARAERRDLTERIRRVLTDPEGLQVVFQPIACLRSAGVGGYEALARFPTLGLRPDIAIAHAHTAGIGPELEAAAIRRALAEPGRPAGTTLTLNVSLSALASPNLWAELPADLSGVTIEVTEHELYESDHQLELSLERLRARGARIAVDDTGSGYAGLQQLQRVRPDMIKLDRALVAGVASDRTLAALIEAFVRFAEATDAMVCAEGVEELDDLRTLAALGVGSAQGYGLARPAFGWAGLAPEAVAVLTAVPARAQVTPAG